LSRQRAAESPTAVIATFCPAYLHPMRRDLSDALERMDEA